MNLKKRLPAVTVGLATGLVFVLLMNIGLLDTLEWKIDDSLMAWSAGVDTVNEDVVIIMIDQGSIEWAADDARQWTWPWPRQVYALLTSYLAESGAVAFGFDGVFDKYSSWGEWDDQAYIDALRSTDIGVGALFLSNEYGEPAWSPELSVPAESSTSRNLPAYELIQNPLPEFGSAYPILGNVQVGSDADGVFRRIAPAAVFDDKVVPSLALAMYRAGNPGQGVLTDDGRHLLLDGERLPSDSAGRLTLRHRGPSLTHTTYSAAQVIESAIQLLVEGVEPTLDPSVFEGKYVLFGANAKGLLDIRPSPLDDTFAGVEHHATLLDNLLSDEFILPVDSLGVVPTIAVSLLLLLYSILSSILVTSVQNTKYGMAVSLLVFFALILGAVLLTAPWYFLDIDLPVVPFFGVAVFSTALAFILNYATVGHTARLIKGIFSEFMNDDYVDILIDQGEMPKLGGEKKELTIFFSDLQGFTTISEGLEPEELTELLNVYLTEMSDIIMEEGGTIDKYEGDAIIAFWNAPLDLEEHAVRGIRSMLRCQEKLAEMRPELKELSRGRDLLMRIGMNTGEVVVGNMGSVNHKNYTFFGDAGNLAARLEGVNKQFGTYSMISEYTLEAARAGGFKAWVRELARVEVVGKSEPVTVFEPMTKEAWDAGADIWPAFGRALDDFYQGRLDEARTGFAALADRDPAAAKYVGKIDSMEGRVPVGWNGIWVMTSK